MSCILSRERESCLERIPSVTKKYISEFVKIMGTHHKVVVHDKMNNKM